MCSSLTFSKLLGDHWVIFVNSLLCPSAKEIGAQRLFRVLQRLGTAEVSLAPGIPSPAVFLLGSPAPASSGPDRSAMPAAFTYLVQIRTQPLG